MQKLYALMLLLMMALVACTSAEAPAQQNQAVSNPSNDTTFSEKPRFLISYATW